MRILLALTLLAAGLIAVPPMAPPPATSAALDEYQVKAAYLFNFARFVDWPPSAGSRGPIVIGVLGMDPFGDSIERVVRGRTVKGRSVSVRRFRSVRELEQAHILYIAASEWTRIKDVLAQIDGTPVLAVSDVPGFLKVGGGIAFVMVNGRVRFDINLSAISNVNLTMDSQLLQVARTVESAGR
jgi:hypothetical protein